MRGLVRLRVAVTLSGCSTSANDHIRGPLGMARCVWLLTLEQVADLPPLYMRIGSNRVTGHASVHR